MLQVRISNAEHPFFFLYCFWLVLVFFFSIFLSHFNTCTISPRHATQVKSRLRYRISKAKLWCFKFRMRNRSQSTCWFRSAHSLNAHISLLIVTAPAPSQPEPTEEENPEGNEENENSNYVLAYGHLLYVVLYWFEFSLNWLTILFFSFEIDYEPGQTDPPPPPPPAPTTTTTTPRPYRPPPAPPAPPAQPPSRAPAAPLVTAAGTFSSSWYWALILVISLLKNPPFHNWNFVYLWIFKSTVQLIPLREVKRRTFFPPPPPNGDHFMSQITARHSIFIARSFVIASFFLFVFPIFFFLSSGNDDCAGVVCPEVECETQQYIRLGECCPVCAGQFLSLI